MPARSRGMATGGVEVAGHQRYVRFVLRPEPSPVHDYQLAYARDRLVEQAPGWRVAEEIAPHPVYEGDRTLVLVGPSGGRLYYSVFELPPLDRLHASQHDAHFDVSLIDPPWRQQVVDQALRVLTHACDDLDGGGRMWRIAEPHDYFGQPYDGVPASELWHRR